MDVPTLALQLAEPDPPTVIDVRWTLGGPPGWDGYVAGHIPGAAFLDLDRDVAGPPGSGGRHPLPEPSKLQDALRAAGVRSGHPVVCYDAGDGLAAARLWWTLRWAGHPAVSVLDGGLAAWVAGGQALQAGASAPAPGDIVVTAGGMPTLDAAAALALAREGLLLDARAEARYRGEVEPIDPVAGHIPGAVNLPASSLVDPATGRLLPAAGLRALLASKGAGAGPSPRTAGAYCGSGVTAAQTVLALEVAGYPCALYVGSWSEWVSDPDRPVATGEQP